MSYLFEPSPPVVAAVLGSDSLFPVHRIYCVGRNYAAHAREMGGDPSREAPFFFLKPADALIPSGRTIPYPLDTANLHHEIELVIAIGKGGSQIAQADALDHVFGYAVGLDLTRRDRQFEARDKGRPWDIGKGFDNAAPMGPIHPAALVGHPVDGRIWLSVNGEVRQDADIDQLIWSVPEVVSILSRSWELRPGDLIFTGTPDKVGPISPGDTVTGGIDELGEVMLTVAPIPDAA